MATATDRFDGAPPAADGWGLLVSVARWRLDEQLSRIRSLDDKLAATFSLNAATVALFGAALALSDRTLPHHIWGLALSVLAVFVVNLLFSYRAYQQQNWSLRPDLQDLEAVIEAHSRASVERWIAREISASLEHNETRLLDKARDARRAFALAIFDAILIGVTAVSAIAPFA